MGERSAADGLALLDVAGLHHASAHGGSRSLVMEASDGRLVLVKFKSNPQSTRALIGDLVGTRLGLRAGAAFAPAVLVRVPLGRLADIPRLRRQPWEPGLQFGTVFYSGATPLDAARDGSTLANLRQLPVTALVELWLHNGDLKPSHVLRVPAPAGPVFRVIDHGHILPHGPSWSRARLVAFADHSAATDVDALTALARAVRAPFDFEEGLRACLALDDDALTALVGEVPAEWGLDRVHARSLVDFLARRRRLLPGWAARLAELWQT